MKAAPLHNELAEGPDGGRAFWQMASDDVRLRVAHWPGGRKGTVFLFPGRTEYIEKYGRAAADIAARGLGTVTIDWRGQGLSDRLQDNPFIGHVAEFADYQLDVDAMLAAARALDAPEPYYLLAHSMGGCIGLRTLHRDMPFRKVIFSGPMWGISIPPYLMPVAWTVPAVSAMVGLGHLRAPGSVSAAYVLTQPFEGNELTTDPDMYEYIRRQTEQIEGLEIIGPSMLWLLEAIAETRELRRMAPPPIEAMTFLGGNERIVEPRFVRQVMKRWKGGQMHLMAGAEHEIIVERPEIRCRLFDAVGSFFA